MSYRYQRSVLKKGVVLKRGKAGQFGERYAVWYLTLMSQNLFTTMTEDSRLSIHAKVIFDAVL